MRLSSIRNIEIDGIRGWAALFVVLFHFFQEMLGNIFPILHSKYFGFVFDGHLMVLIFFILSGDALSLSFFKEKNTNTTIRLVLTRYFRLTFPVAISCIIVYLLMHFGLTYNIQASHIVNREDWIGSYINFNPQLSHLIKYSFRDVYFNHSEETSFNPFLWTMSIELLGSLLIFINIFIFNYIQRPAIIIAAQIIFFTIFSPLYSLFFIGLLFGYWRKLGYFNKLLHHKLNYLFIIIFFAIAILFSLLRESKTTLLGLSLNRIIEIERLHIFWSSILVFAIYSNSSLLKFFKSKISLFLGDISFPLYIMQFPVLISLFSWLIVSLNRLNLLYTYYTLIVTFVSVLVCGILAYIFRQLEITYLKFINRRISGIIAVPSTETRP